MNLDDSIRTATRNVESTVLSYLEMDEDNLYRRLGTHSADIATKGVTSSNYRPTLTADDILRSQDTLELGKRLFRRWSRSLHQLICGGDQEDAELRQKIVNAFTGSKENLAALIAAIVVSAFGAAPAIAALVSALLVKYIIAPAGDEVCSFWNEKLKERP